MTSWMILTLVGLVVVLWADATGRRTTVGRIAKPIASAGFVGVALAGGALASLEGNVGLLALGLCWWGDVFLLGDGRRWFVAGLSAFALAHLAYAVAFVLHGVDPMGGTAGAFGMGIFALVVGRWLFPGVPGALRGPVGAYVLILSGTVALAMGTGAVVLIVGAWLFALSDLFVARQRFVQPGPVNRRIGLPLYYAAQVVLAVGIAGA